MDVNDPQFEAYETRFRQLAEQAELVKSASPSLNASRYYLFLYGENGLPPEEEFQFLDKMEAAHQEGSPLRRMEIEIDYFQDTVLFIP